MSNFIPNSFQVPNAYIDKYWHLLTPPEKDVMIYAMRRIFGFQKIRDRISISLFTDGMRNKNGEQLDHGTGLGREAVINALNSLKKFGFILLISENDPKINAGAEYELQFDENLIDIQGLLGRKAQKSGGNNARIEKARAKQNLVPGLSHRPDPVCPTDQTRSVPQTHKRQGNQEKNSLGENSPAPAFSQFDTPNTLENQNLTGSKDGVELLPEKMPTAPKPAATKKEKAEGKAAASAKDFPAVQMYHRIIGRYPNRLSWQTVTNAVNAVSERLGRPATISDLNPFAVAWSDKYGNSVSVNLAWLTEWAVKGEVPAHALPQKPKYNQSPDSGIAPRSIR